MAVIWDGYHGAFERRRAPTSLEILMEPATYLNWSQRFREGLDNCIAFRDSLDAVERQIIERTSSATDPATSDEMRQLIGMRKNAQNALRAADDELDEISEAFPE